MHASPSFSFTTLRARRGARLLLSLSAVAILYLLCAGVGLSVAPQHIAPQHAGRTAVAVEPVGNSVVRGRVVYEDTGRPVRRAKVQLLRADLTAASEQQNYPNADYAGTDRDGEFEIKGLTAGRYLVVVESPEIVSPLALIDSESELARGVASGKIKTDFAAVSVDGTTDARVEVRARRGGAVTGRVTYGDGQPLAGGEVSLYRVRDGALTQVLLYRANRSGVHTDANGVYRVFGLPAGDYVVRAIESSNPDTSGEPDDEGAYMDAALLFTYHPNTPSLKGAKVVHVEAGAEAADVDIVFPDRPSHTVEGRVLTRRGERPVEFVRLTLELDEEGYDDSMPTTFIEAWTDEEGRWSFAGVPDGTYTLNVTRSPAPDDDIPVTDDGEEGPDKFYVAVSRELKVEGADVRGVEIRMAEGASVSGVVVVEGGGKPPAEVALTAVSDGEGHDGGDEAGSRAAPAEGGATGEGKKKTPLLSAEDLRSAYEGGGDATAVGEYDAGAGKFGIERVAPGNVWVHAEVPGAGGFYVKAVTRRGVDLLRAPLNVREAEKVTGVRVVLARGAATLAGRVVTKSGASAGADVDVVLVPTDPVRRRYHGASLAAMTEPDGTFSVAAPPGEYFVFAMRVEDYLTLVLSEEDVAKESAAWPRVTLRPAEKRATDVPLQEEK
jgi:hypothetical protein